MQAERVSTHHVQSNTPTVLLNLVSTILELYSRIIPVVKAGTETAMHVSRALGNVHIAFKSPVKTRLVIQVYGRDVVVVNYHEPGFEITGVEAHSDWSFIIKTNVKSFNILGVDLLLANMLLSGVTEDSIDEYTDPKFRLLLALARNAKSVVEGRHELLSMFQRDVLYSRGTVGSLRMFASVGNLELETGFTVSFSLLYPSERLSLEYNVMIKKVVEPKHYVLEKVYDETRYLGSFTKKGENWVCDLSLFGQNLHRFPVYNAVVSATRYLTLMLPEITNAVLSSFTAVNAYVV